MRSLLVAAVVASAQLTAAPPRTGSLGSSVTGVSSAPLSTTSFSSTTTIGASTPIATADRQFLFANPAADAIALDALKPNATNPFLSLLIAGSIDSSSGGSGGGYQQPYRPPYNPYPTYPTYPSYPSSYPSSSYSYSSYPSYPAASYYPTPSYPAYSTPSYSSYTPSYSSYTPSYSSYTPSYSSYTPSYSSYTPSYYNPYPAYTPPPPSYPVSYPSASFPDPPNDPLKQAIILNGIQKGTINSVAAVGLDRNPDMSALGAQVFSSLGNNPLTTTLAVSGGLGGNNYYSQFGGNVFGDSTVGNYLFYNQVLGGSSPFGR